MGSAHHSEWEGWDEAQSDGTVHLSRALDYIILTTHIHPKAVGGRTAGTAIACHFFLKKMTQAV